MPNARWQRAPSLESSDSFQGVPRAVEVAEPGLRLDLPAAVNFVVGQVAFSVLVVVLFNILAPTDWQIGLVRVEDAALGVGISAIAGLLLWPRGAQGQLRSALADLYDAAASSLSFSFRRMLSDANEPD